MPWLLACDFVGSSIHLPIKSSGIARLSGWIELTGEAFL